MGKYIEADKLIAKIKQLAKTNKELKLNRFTQGIAAGYDDVLSAIASLQQEQPKVDLVAELKHHLATTPKEQLEKKWKELEPWDNIGPTVQEFLYGKQPEVDLEKEIECSIRFLNGHHTLENGERWYKGRYEELRDFARHFYSLGLNERKED